MACLISMFNWQALSKQKAPIHQDDIPYRCWFFTTVALVLLSAWLEPFKLAFMATPDMWPFDGWAAVQVMSTCAFCLDTCLHFLVVKTPRVGGTGGHTLGEVAHAYVRGLFVVDVLACFPWTAIVVTVLGIQGQGGNLGRYVALLNLLRMLRLYRLLKFFGELSYNTSVSQIANMVVRNTVFVLILMHWAACIFWWIARQEGFSEDTWVGHAQERFVGNSMLSNYTYSYYLAMSTFTGMGDNDLSVDSSWAECLITSVFLLLSIILMSYILGTFTMLLMANDKRSKKFRERMTNLGAFNEERKLPRGLLQAMKEHVQLHHNSEQLDDDKVLHGIPTLLRRTVLRHLYMDPLSTCYMFQGCSPLFIDSVMMACKVDLFMPKVQVLSAGDMVTDLLIIVGGAMALIDTPVKANIGLRTSASHPERSRAMAPAAKQDSAMLDTHFHRHSSNSHHGHANDNGSVHGSDGESVHGSVYGASHHRQQGFARHSDMSRCSSMASSMASYTGSDGYGGALDGLGTSRHGASNSNALKWADAICQLSFFTEGPSSSTAVTTEVTRIASLSRPAWEALLAEFPKQGIIVYENLVRQEEQNLEAVITLACEQQQITPSAAAVLLRLLQDGDEGTNESHEATATARDCLAPQQLTQLQQLTDIKVSAAEHAKSVKDAVKFEFLNTAAAGATAKLQLLLESGADVNMVDFGGRTALMLAAFSGHTETLQLLLNRGAKHGMHDKSGHTAMFEAVKAGKDDVMDMLLATGATLGLDKATAAGYMNDCMSQAPTVPAKLKFLRRLLRAGVDPNSSDYDSRSALHTAASAGYLVGVKLLVEEGHASLTQVDRWQHTALDDAQFFGYTEVVAYLEHCTHRNIPEPLSTSKEGSGMPQGSGSALRDKVWGLTPAQCRERFTSACMTGQLAKVQLLLENLDPAEPLSQLDISTGLLAAASQGHEEVVRLIASTAVGLDLSKPVGDFALRAAAVFGDENIIQGLQGAGCRKEGDCKISADAQEQRTSAILNCSQMQSNSVSGNLSNCVSNTALWKNVVNSSDSLNSTPDIQNLRSIRGILGN